MRSTLMPSVDDDTMRIAKYFAGRYAKAILEDFKEGNYAEDYAIVFAMRVIDSDPVRTSFDQSLFDTRMTTHTANVIREACIMAVTVHEGAGVFAVNIARDVCREICNGFNKGRMGEVVYGVFERAFGDYPQKELRAFWNYLGIEMDEHGLFPLPWPGDPLSR